MSRDTCGRSFDTFFDRMGKHNFRQMGFRSDSEGLQTGIHSKTFFSRHKRNSYPKLSNHSIKERNRESFKQKCNRKSSETGYYERPLKYSFSGSKEKREDETCIKPSTSQQVSSEETFQNGLYEKSHTISRKRRLVHNSKLSRCILSPKNIQAPSQISSIQFQGQGVSVLSFGPTVSPRVFSKVTTVVAAYLRQQSIRLPTYLDEWLFLNQNTMEKSIHHSKFRLGFIINKEKSNLLPSQDLTYIGGHFLLAEGLVFPTLERVQGLRVSVQHFLQSYNTARDYLLGKIASCLEMVPNARLFIRPIQMHLLQNWSPIRMSMDYQIPVTPWPKPHLRWWLQEANILKGQSVQPIQFTETVTTDASLVGWGVHMNNLTVQGR